MKLTFSFTDYPKIEDTPRADIYSSHIELPNEVKHLIAYEKRILLVGELIGSLSDASVYLTCMDIGAKNRLISKGRVEALGRELLRTPQIAILYFNVSSVRKRRRSKQLKIYLPVQFEHINTIRRAQKRTNGLVKSLIFPKQMRRLAENIEPVANAIALSDQMLVLLNSSPEMDWQFVGYHPWWRDNRLIDRLNKRYTKISKEKKKSTGEPHPKTGAGRRPGAIPGEFMGVTFRSQLEIRLATELQSRGIEWIYEYERLGKGNYLVDFYLPKLKTWIEVKGRFEPRDNYLLREVSDYLHQERGERLFVYTSGRPFIVEDGEFQKISRNAFWNTLSSNK